MTTETTPKVTRTVSGDSEMLSYTDKNGDFIGLIQPRMATAQEINDALAKAVENDPNVSIGNFQGVTFTKTKKRYK